MSYSYSHLTIPHEKSTSINLVAPLRVVRERILIVDDSVTVRKIFTKCLSTYNDCLEAASVPEALEQLKNNQFALVITDVMMPGIPGTDLLRKIIENYPDVAVIMVSGIDQPRRVLDAMRLGAFDYLFKPCDLDVLQLSVDRALERRQLLLETRQNKLDLQTRNEELALGKAKLERLQGQMVHREKMASLGQLAAGIAHELNNPVGFIYGNMDLLNGCIQDLKKLLNYFELANLPEATRSGADLIQEQIDYRHLLEDLDSIIADTRDGAERIRDIVQNLRTFSRLDEAEFTKSDVHEGIDSTLRLLSGYFKDGKIKLTRNFGKLPLIESFSGQLNQVWMNLLVNALQSIGSSGGEIRVTTQSNGEFVFVWVIDSGKGIKAEHLNRIFDPFFTTKAVGEGTGLGLSISFGIIKRHQGTIGVKSSPGQGSSFMVKLPIKLKTSG
jgi:two-component system NtrC family sensor kinase